MQNRRSHFRAFAIHQFIRQARCKARSHLLLGLAIGALAGVLRGQQDGTRQWRFTVGGYITHSSPALSPDGTKIYVGVETSTAGRVIAITREGGALPLWGPRGREVPAGIDSSPVVTPDGNTIYIGGGNGTLYALNASNGSSIWERPLGGFISSSPAIGIDGTIYVGAADGRLHAVSPGGVEKWPFPTGDIIFSSPAIGSDGTIYFGSDDRIFYAVTPAGQEKWRFVTGGRISSSPAIGADGTIYFGSADQRLYALAPDGTKKWDYPTGGPIDASPALGADGTIYFASDRNFYALRPDESGERLRWKVDVNTSSISTAAVRADGTIIFGADDGVVRALSPGNGGKVWNYDTESGPDNLIESSPIVAPDGSIYVGSIDGHLYKLNGNGSPLSSYSSWPAFRRDIRHTARAVAPNTGGQLVNIASRAQAGGGNNLIAGFIVQGAIEKAYLVRAIGPTLAQPPLNVPDFMADPRLLIYSGREFLRENNNWGESDIVTFGIADTAAAVGAFPLPVGSKDAALVPILPAGAYTAQIQATDNGSGIALVEVYDATGDASGQIRNLSTRGQVGTGGNILIAGVVVGGTGSVRLLLRGIGPGLTQFGVPGVLAQPRMEVFRGTTSLGANAGWTTDGYKADLAGAAAAVAAFSLSETSTDCAMLFNALPGPYTIQVSGVGGTTGEALVEVYLLP